MCMCSFSSCFSWSHSRVFLLCRSSCETAQPRRSRFAGQRAASEPRKTEREKKGETEEERVNTVRVTVQPWCCVRRGEGQRTRTYNSFPLYPALCSVHTLCLTCLFSGWLVFHPCHYHTTTRRLTHLGASLHHASRFSPSHSLQTLVDRLKPSWLP